MSSDVRRLALALPVVFVLHVVEEAPRFVAWVNSRVTPPISEQSFLAVNLGALMITLGVSVTVVLAAPFKGSRLF